MINRRWRLSKGRTCERESRSIVRGYRNQDGLGRDNEQRGQPFESGMGIHNPHPLLFNVALVGLVQGLEHVDMPLSELMHPFGDQMRAVRISNHVVKTMLIEISQCQKNKEIIKRKTYHKWTLAIKYDDDQGSVQAAIGQKHEEEHSEEGRPDEFQKVHSGPARTIGRVGTLAFSHGR